MYICLIRNYTELLFNNTMYIPFSLMSSQPSKTLKQIIAEHYFYSIRELFIQIDKSDVIKTSDKLNIIQSIGVNAIHRVFEYVLLQKKNIDHAKYHSQQACYYFLEYIEQIHLSGLTHSLNNKDAVLFVYKKTIFEMRDDDSVHSSNTISNILTMSDDLLNINNNEWRNMYSRILNIVNLLFYWNNQNYTFQDRKHICDELLLRYLYAVEKLDFATVYLENIQSLFQPNIVTYMALLKSMITKSEKMRRVRSGSVTEQDKNEQILNKFSIHRDIVKEKYDSGNMDELVNWLYSNNNA